ncbi:unnamed protein product, partial [Rotaria magnacalcarata]
VTTNANWHSAYDANGETVVQLFAVGSATNPNSEWSFYNKPQPSVPKSIGDYVFGGEGITHVTSYNCNSNPKNRVSGHCILTIPDALTQCNSDPNCGGIGVTTNADWHNAYDASGETVVQLFAVGTATTPNAEWNCFNKNKQTVPKSIGDYVFGGEGITHVTSYNCNSNPKNRVSGHCILTIPDALTQCNSDPNCGGIGVTTNADWHNAYDANGETVVQLFAVGTATTPNAEWNSFNKRQRTVRKSIGDYAFGGEGINHVSSYNCNSNPKNRVTGYCILTIPDAVAQCNSDANCGGYDVTTNVDWHNAYDVNCQTVVQLFALGAATNPNIVLAPRTRRQSKLNDSVNTNIDIKNVQPLNLSPPLCEASLEKSISNDIADEINRLDISEPSSPMLKPPNDELTDLSFPFQCDGSNNSSIKSDELPQPERLPQPLPVALRDFYTTVNNDVTIDRTKTDESYEVILQLKKEKRSIMKKFNSEIRKIREEIKKLDRNLSELVENKNEQNEQLTQKINEHILEWNKNNGNNKKKRKIVRGGINKRKQFSFN